MRLFIPLMQVNAVLFSGGGLQFTQEIEDLFGIPVGVEGHYPTPNGKQHWLISTWQEYQQLLESGVNYALDLSHLNILAVQTNHVEWSLVHELLSSPHCLEIHLSDNHGYADQHLPLSNPHCVAVVVVITQFG